MALSDAAAREIAKVLRKHVAPRTLDEIAAELVEIRGDKDFRDTTGAIVPFDESGPRECRSPNGRGDCRRECRILHQMGNARWKPRVSRLLTRLGGNPRAQRAARS